ncbi:hypothetical protein LTR84_003561 [Exophiala bonariae]|uniref:ABC a-pheromone efflux pump AtrD n=1 Tax=Exophiala bonariae TaxID=1690606 RepID=A0AAV9NB14_9EURO|nr:hypothetical protein LTR84_003561 [Exophiala bonariae]
MSSIDPPHPPSDVASSQGHETKGWRFLFAFTRKAHLLVLLAAILLSLAAGLLLPATIIFLGAVFNSFSEYASGNIEVTTFTEEMRSSTYAFLILGAATILLRGGFFTCWLQFGELQAKCVREDLFRTLLEKDQEWYDLQPTGVETLLSRTQTQIRDLRTATSQPLGFSIAYIAQALAALALALFTNWRLSLVIVASLPIMAVGVALTSCRMLEYTERHNHSLTHAVRLANYSISNIVILKCFNTQYQEEERYGNIVRTAAVDYLKLAFSNALQAGFTRSIGSAMFVQGFWYGGSQVHAGQTTTGKVIITFWGCVIAAKSFETILPQGILLQKGRAAALVLKGIIGDISEDQIGLSSGRGLIPPFCGGKIEFRGVSFGYPSNAEHLILRDFSLYFPEGQTTYLVGNSGCGKSTIGSLLLRFYAPNSRGKILLDGMDVHDLDKAWLRNNITLVQQQSHLFSGTIHTNVALGQSDPSLVTEDEVQRCLELAALEATVAAFPDGPRTMVGTGGSALSGGQKQRIALARAYLRDTPVLLLDEVTSALDYSTRTRVMETIRSWRRGRTTIIITHDLDQIRPEDLVYVLDAGVVVQQGLRKDIADLANRLTIVSKNQDSDQKPFQETRAIFSISSPSNNATRIQIAGNRVSRWKESLDHFGAPTITNMAPLDSPTNVRRQTLKNSIALGVQGALVNLKRQSIARAKFLYAPIPSHPALPLTDKSHTPPGELLASLRRTDGFLGQRNKMSDLHNKPLPIPLATIENPLEPTYIMRIRKSKNTQEPKPPLSLFVILKSVFPGSALKIRVRLAIALVATICHAAMGPIFSYILAQVVNTFFLQSGYKEKLLQHSLQMLGIACIDGLCCFAMTYLMEFVAQSWVDGLRSKAMCRILRQPKAWFDEETHKPSTIVAALDQNAEEVKDIVSKFAAQIVIVAVMVLVAMTWAFVTCWKITLVSLAGTPVVYGLAKTFDLVSAHWENSTNMKSDNIGVVFVDAFMDIKTVRALTLESYFHQKLSSATHDALSTGRRRAFFSGIFYGLSESAVHFLTALIFWYGAKLAKEQDWAISSILTSFSLILFAATYASATMTYIPQINSAQDTATRLLGLAQMLVVSHEDKGTFILDATDPSTLTGPIHFINQTFRYPTRPDTSALFRLNLTIPSGRYTAIVGGSGSGKSTITALILGLYPPSPDMVAQSPSFPFGDPPSLTLSGRDIRSLHLKILRSMISIVPQTPVLIPGTVRENIAYGLQADVNSISASRIEAAAHMAGIHEFIQSLPQGYASVVGEGGIGMSGGQAQRVVVARALIRNPRILILDEPTSALDDDSARVIKNSIVRLMQEKGSRLTVILVTHSKAMMSFADHVIVMKEGAVAEQGSYAELLARPGELSEMLHNRPDW